MNKPWGELEKKQWLEEQSIKRSYKEEVLSKIEPMKETYDVQQYGALSYDQDKYPLYIIKTKGFNSEKKTRFFLVIN